MYLILGENSYSKRYALFCDNTTSIPFSNSLVPSKDTFAYSESLGKGVCSHPKDVLEATIIAYTSDQGRSSSEVMPSLALSFARPRGTAPTRHCSLLFDHPALVYLEYYSSSIILHNRIQTMARSNQKRSLCSQAFLCCTCPYGWG